MRLMPQACGHMAVWAEAHAKTLLREAPEKRMWHRLKVGLRGFYLGSRLRDEQLVVAAELGAAEGEGR